MAGFHHIGELEKVATDFFYRWGYKFYRDAKKPRADDMLIRQQVDALLLTARKSVEAAEREHRRETLLPPSRSNPRPNADAIATAQTLEQLAKSIGTLQTLLTSQPAPDDDIMTKRYHQEAGRLVELDQILTGQAELLRETVDRKKGLWLIENMTDVQEGIIAIAETLRRRKALLVITS